MTRSRPRSTLRPLPAAALGVASAVGLALVLSPVGSTSALWRAVDTAPVPALSTGGLVVDLDLLEAPDAPPALNPTPAPALTAPEEPAPGVPTGARETEETSDAAVLDSLEPSADSTDGPSSATTGTGTP
ncbi:hypothetical protein [Oerskovia paurometabola]|uniref:hypothetical protein n=1 Tax=Oerskovia paurometabola TaxID=162170 RepID=UPI00382DF92F